MKLESASQYVDFFLGLHMEGVGLIHFANNEKMALKQRLRYKGADRKSLALAISVLEQIAREVKESGEDAVIARHATVLHKE